MFAGLGISIDIGSGAQTYTATGAYPYLGYVTVIWAGNVSRANCKGRPARSTGARPAARSGRPIHVGGVRMGHL
jgi:hypothetical protein